METKPKPERANTLIPIKLSCETYNKLLQEEQVALTKQQEEAAEKKNQEAEACDPSSETVSSAASSRCEQLAEATTGDVPSQPSHPTEVHAPDKTAQKKDSSDPNTTNDWGDYAPYVTYEGEKAIYTDPSNQQKYTWNKETNAWDKDPEQDPSAGRQYSYENDTHIYTEADGSKFFYDVSKKAWIPKVDDDFLAYYQMSYGFVDNTAKVEEKKEEDKQKIEEKKEKAGAGVKRKTEPQWFDASNENNTKVYVSNLPEDLTEEEFVALMQKCGLVERHPGTQKMKVKLYMDKEQNCFKGDALCTYIKIESVDLALKLIDGSDLRGNTIKVERASFQLKGEYNPALKPKKKKKKELEKIKKMQQKLFDWRPEKILGERGKHEKVVIVKNLFHPSDFDNDVQLILDYQQDLREECSKAGEVRKVTLYDRHPEGVAQISMKEPEMADAAVLLINGRWFGKRKITAEIWDGKTKYKIAETDADINKRIDKWDKFLEGKGEQDTKPDTKDQDTKPEDKKDSSTREEETITNTTDQVTSESTKIEVPSDSEGPVTRNTL